MQNGQVTSYDGDLDDYRRLLLEQRRAERSRGRAGKRNKDEVTAVSKKEQRRQAAEARAAVADLRRNVRETEARMEKLAGRKMALEAKLADPEVYNGPTAKLMDLQVKFGELKRELEAVEEEWLEAQAALESASEAQAS